MPTFPQDPAPRRPRPVDVFAELNGAWGGTFVGYAEDGKELYRIDVHQRYETVDANTQKVEVRDTMADGTVIRGEGENTAHRQADGTLQLRCVVRKSNGETVRHDGRLVRGPGGQQQLVWFSKSDDRTETFREWVIGHGDKAEYHIQGMGTYSGTPILMAGTYARK